MARKRTWDSLVPTQRNGTEKVTASVDYVLAALREHLDLAHDGSSADVSTALVEGAADIRGLWIGVEGDHVGHVERVEQCGRRTVITSSGIIHDYGPNSTLDQNTNDTLCSTRRGLRARESNSPRLDDPPCCRWRCSTRSAARFPAVRT